MNCDHYHQRERWVTRIDDWTGEETSEWEYTTESAQVDIGIGAFRCTICGEVGYYTGSWRRYYENGEPCFGSERASPTETAAVRRSIRTTERQRHEER